MNTSTITSTSSTIFSTVASVAVCGWSYVQPIAAQAQNLAVRVYGAVKPFFLQLWEAVRTPGASGALALCGAFYLLTAGDDRESYEARLPYHVAAVTCAAFAGFFFSGIVL